MIIQINSACSELRSIEKRNGGMYCAIGRNSDVVFKIGDKVAMIYMQKIIMGIVEAVEIDNREDDEMITIDGNKYFSTYMDYFATVD